MTASLGPLRSGARVVIIGGGPGGTGCALALQQLARQRHLDLQIIVLEGKQFAGEQHYNQCAGVLSPPLPDLLEKQLNLRFPDHISRGKINGYVVHTDRESIRLDEQHTPSVAVRRIQFDAYMLDAVRKRGITVLPARAVDLEFHADRVIVYTESASLACDVVVGAFGLDEGSAAMLARQSSYRPPLFLTSVVTKYHPRRGTEAFGQHIHAFLLADPRIEFGAVTPKGNHLTINIAGKAVDIPAMEAFLRHPAVRAVLIDSEQIRTSDNNGLRFFKGRFPRSLARGFYGDRYVLVGDAAGLVRAFKGKGVTSAVLTGIRAAHTLIEAGISQRAFANHYRPANHDIISDLPYGRLMRKLTIAMAQVHLLDPVLRAADHQPALQAALFDAVSAHDSYQRVLARTLRPSSVAAIVGEMVRI